MRISTIPAQLGQGPQDPRPAPKNLRVKNGKMCCVDCGQVPEQCRCRRTQLGDLVLVMT